MSRFVTLHRDGTATVWDCMKQVWLLRVRHVSDAILSSLNHKDRSRILRHLHIAANAPSTKGISQ